MPKRVISIIRGLNRTRLRFALIVLVTTSLADCLYGQSGMEKVATELLGVDRVSNIIVSFEAHPGFGSDIRSLDKELKGAIVYESLKAYQASTQGETIRLLAESGIGFKAYCVANAIWIPGDISTSALTLLASNSQVKSITKNDLIPVQRVREADGTSRSAVEWGIARIGADSIWKQGILGQGVVIGGEDTGYEWTHPAISHNYRGNMGDTIIHDYNWFDAVHELSPLHGDTVGTPTPCGVSNPVPCDDHGHGTHTMGTMVGLDGDNMIGVAPDATWVGVRCMDRGYGSPMTYIGGFEWFLAPTDVEGNNPDPALAPHVINNSWRCPPMEGCNPDNYELMRQAIVNLRAAGIVVVVSAGNEGSLGCSSLADPPGIFEESFAVGATRSNDTIAGFSSRGPIMIDSSGRVKPDISAPGVAVRSAWRDSSYRSLNGTSMAGPHVAGTVALMISANPEIAGQVELIEDILRQTARPAYPIDTCGDDASSIPNNSYGYGIINAIAAVEEAMMVSSVADATPSHKLSLFPNPSSGRVTFNLEAVQGPFQVRLTTLQGAEIQRFTVDSNTGHFDLGDVPTGMYLLIFEGGGEVIVGKVVRG